MGLKRKKEEDSWRKALDSGEYGIGNM